MAQDPGLRVVFRQIIQGFYRRLIVEAFKSGSIVSVDELFDESISLLMGVELVLASVSAIRRRVSNGVSEAPVEALDHAVGLRSEGADQAMVNILSGANPVEGMMS